MGGHARARGSLDLYLKEIGRLAVPTREEERDLARRIRDGEEEALQELVSRNLRFVVSVARRYRGRGLSLADLVNEGNVGMIRAARRFDGERGVRFVTYAAWWIRQAILEAIGEQSGREGDSGGRSRRPRWVSLDAAGPDGGSLAERTPDPGAVPPDAPGRRRELRGAVARSLASLPEREARVLRLHFGLDGEDPLPLAAVSRRMSLSRSRVRQLRDQGLRRLRSGAAGTVLATFLG